MHKPNILICDDDENILEVMQIILENNEFNVIIDSDGHIIENINQSNKPDLIFLDIWLKNKDGRDIIQKLKESPNTKDIPVILISALNEIENIAGQYKADDYLPKPFSLDSLVNKAQKFLNLDIK